MLILHGYPCQRTDFLNVTPKEYGEMAKACSPNSKSHKNIPAAFLVGGLICAIGQVSTNFWLSRGVEATDASTITSMSLIFLASLLTGLDVYKSIAKFAGAGTLVPITGFSNSVASPALEFKSEGLILGLGAKLFIIAGPVLTYGIAASVLYGFLYWMLR